MMFTGSHEETCTDPSRCNYTHGYITNTYLDPSDRYEKKVSLPKPPDPPSTFGRAKNPMVRTDKKLQRGF